jgi:hypothetical protein
MMTICDGSDCCHPSSKVSFSNPPGSSFYAFVGVPVNLGQAAPTTECGKRLKEER